MNSVRVRIILCCAAAIFASGCPSAPSDPCGGICDADQVCVDGACVECAGQEDCDDQDACTTDSCAGEVGCINAPITCNTAADCPAGCNVSCNALFFCSNSDPCDSCDPTEICINGVCVECEITADCLGNNEICVDSLCVACNDNNVCTRDSRVVDEQTVEFVCSYVFAGCATVFDCPPECNVACINNFCFAPP